MKKDANDWRAKVRTAAKHIYSQLLPIELHLASEEAKVVEAEAKAKAEEEEKQRAIIQSRVDELLKYGKPMPFMELAVLDDEEYDTLLFDVKEDFKAEEERKAEEEAAFQKEKARLAKIAEEQDAERKRLADIAQHAEEARIAEEAILQKEKDSIATQLKEIKDEKARIAQEVADKLAVEESIMLGQKAAKEEAERKAKEEIEKTERLKADKDRQERLAPDKELLVRYLNEIESEIEGASAPALSTDELLAAFNHINALLYEAIAEGRKIIKAA